MGTAKLTGWPRLVLGQWSKPRGPACSQESQSWCVLLGGQWLPRFLWLDCHLGVGTRQVVAVLLCRAGGRPSPQLAVLAVS